MHKLPFEVKLTDEIYKIITNCPKLAWSGSKECLTHCPLAVVCCEYWIGEKPIEKD